MLDSTGYRRIYLCVNFYRAVIYDSDQHEQRPLNERECDSASSLLDCAISHTKKKINVVQW